MSLATLYSRARSGIDAPQVTVEVHLASGLPAFSIVGLPEKAVQERKRGRVTVSVIKAPILPIVVLPRPGDAPLTQRKLLQAGFVKMIARAWS